MPFVRIDVPKGPAGFAEQAGEAVHRALVDSLGIPEGDRFQVLTEHEPGRLVADRSFLGVERSERVVLVEVTLVAGRSVALKRTLYAAVADRLAEVGVRREDVLISLNEVRVEDFSFGEGKAQYADSLPPHLAAKPAQAQSSASAPAPDATPVASLPFTAAVPHGDFTFISGQVGVDPATGALPPGGVAAQFEQAVANLEAVLGARGRTLADVVRVGVYLTDMADYAAMNDAYREAFAEPYPARTAIGVAGLPLGAVVEIDAIVGDRGAR
ncbi:Rid family detoxifying hydrolase [Catenulispora sp. NF23]|uniref:Rid family detoxifying hydrolase n=1 Tax=Catenulispora pinistramenti TaxID=2705254 RepID=A0ABS5L2E8_9ACTN|nr:Rid family detoxifying hydrolase [Catenulispora pinistramenti]MBS2535934.1 Rid family detoxifying hydrolase [Catenulispora pinistramenti]MBS2552466.1 Rid family detoxifying hydrolase [Catenulispora pinistramenti]